MLGANKDKLFVIPGLGWRSVRSHPYAERVPAGYNCPESAKNGEMAGPKEQMRH